MNYCHMYWGVKDFGGHESVRSAVATEADSIAA